MSINPGIWRKASRLSEPRLLWRALPLPAKAFVLSTAGWLLLLTAARLPWAEAAGHYRQRRVEREALAPLLADARRDSLTFPQVVVSHPAYYNKTVYWNVSVTSATSYAEGRPYWTILWTNPERVEAEHLSYQDERVLARVAAVKEDVVYLEFLGRP